MGHALLLAWRPFIDPINIHEVWFLAIVPLALGISLVYKAIRVKTMDRYWYNVWSMTVQVVVGMFALAVAFYVLVEVIVRNAANR